MKVLVLGSNGQIGNSLRDKLDQKFNDILFCSKKDIDIGNFENTKNEIINFHPEVVINASAYTKVDKAEQEIEEARLINSLAVLNLANVCKSIGSLLIHFSTDYVFDGSSSKPYTEKSKTNPKSVYGQTKLEGEKNIISSSCDFIILRTSWVFSEYGENFLKTMIHLGQEKDELSIVSDQFGNPTYAKDIAIIVDKILKDLKFDFKSQIFNYSGDSTCSWFDFAEEIFEQAKNLNLKTPRIIKKVDSEEFITKAKRPKYSVLDNTKILQQFRVKESNWKLGIREILSLYK
tara:strand:+ start:1343 stop:2212 length:870 start_codon:yes stop_codon:yes gene_type:complete